MHTLALLLASLVSASPAPASPEPPSRADLGPAFEAAGTAAPARTTRLAAKAGGILKAIRVREGAYVNAGQTLCQLDTTDLALRVEGAQVAHDSAEEGLKNAESDLARAEALSKGGSLPDQMLEKAQLGVRMAKLQLAGAKVNLRTVQQMLADATMRAPFAGVITRVLAEEGSMITTMPPSPIFVLVDTSTLEVRTPIPERVLAQVKVGMPVTVELPSVGAHRTARVDALPAVVDAQTRSAEAIIRIDNRDRSLPAGLFARVRFPGVSPETSLSASPRQ